MILAGMLFLSACARPSLSQDTTVAEDYECQNEVTLCDIVSVPLTTEMFGEYYPLVEDTWHLSDWGYIPVKEFWYYEPLDFSEEARKTYVKLPLEYKETVDGITIKVEFFQETYPIFAYIQARITVINESDKILSLYQGYKNAAGYFAANGELYCGAYESPDFDFVTTAAPYAELGKGDAFEAEVIYLFTNRFDADVKDHTYNVELQLYGDGWGPETRSISFPIEVLKTE